jgi:hypothetical protein
MMDELGMLTQSIAAPFVMPDQLGGYYDALGNKVGRSGDLWMQL